MSSSTIEVILSKAEEDIIRSVHKTLRATHYEDPSDQKKFLEECARVLLVFRNRPSSFAMSTELGEYVFLLRAEMHKNSLVLPSPASNYYSSVVDFAGKVARKRIEYFRNLKLAPIKPLPAIDAAKANESHQEAPDAVACTSKAPVTLGDDDAVSIPSDDEYEVVARPSTPIPELLSPLPELQSLMLSLRLNGVAPFSPSSPSPSLPDLVPIESPTLQALPPFHANDAVQVERGRIPRIPTPYPYQRPRRLPILAPMPVLASRDPRLANPAYVRLLQKPNSAGVSHNSKPKSTVSSARKNTRRGSSKSSSKQNSKPASKPNPRRRPKRCYKCHSEWHLIASCPALNFRVD
ncbi:hypothetical protein R3P38DRAFT_3496502 [Favolaschia claudopus]|uniref:Uncharacterized protein n=1 Tax=Favolaschia claudopus TaxID=2862362 RepID=A0AAW0C5I3_9AGAR